MHRPSLDRCTEQLPSTATTHRQTARGGTRGELSAAPPGGFRGGIVPRAVRGKRGGLLALHGSVAARSAPGDGPTLAGAAAVHDRDCTSPSAASQRLRFGPLRPRAGPVAAAAVSLAQSAATPLAGSPLHRSRPHRAGSRPCPRCYARSPPNNQSVAVRDRTIPSTFPLPFFFFTWGEAGAKKCLILPSKNRTLCVGFCRTGDQSLISSKGRKV